MRKCPGSSNQYQKSKVLCHRLRHGNSRKTFFLILALASRVPLATAALTSPHLTKEGLARVQENLHIINENISLLAENRKALVANKKAFSDRIQELNNLSTEFDTLINDMESILDTAEKSHKLAVQSRKKIPIAARERRQSTPTSKREENTTVVSGSLHPGDTEKVKLWILSAQKNKTEIEREQKKLTQEMKRMEANDRSFESEEAALQSKKANYLHMMGTAQPKGAPSRKDTQSPT